MVTYNGTGIAESFDLNRTTLFGAWGEVRTIRARRDHLRR